MANAKKQSQPENTVELPGLVFDEVRSLVKEGRITNVRLMGSEQGYFMLLDKIDKRSEPGVTHSLEASTRQVIRYMKDAGTLMGVVKDLGINEADVDLEGIPT